MYWVLLLGYLFLGNHQVNAQFLEPNCGYMSPEALQNEGHQAHISESPWINAFAINGRLAGLEGP